MSEERVKRKLSAILSADVVGYSRLMQEDEVLTVRTLEAYRKVMSDLIGQFRGRVVDSPGDNLLSEFSSVVDAVQCAVEIHEVIRAKNDELPEDRRMLFRIGVNLGDVIEEGDRIYGDGVNIAARLEGLAEAGGICISGSAHEQIKNKLALGYEYIGEHTVKNISEPLKVYRVPMGPKAAAPKEGDEKGATLRKWRWTALGAAGTIIVIIVVLAIWNFYLRSSSIEPASTESEKAPVVSDIEEESKTIAVLPFVNMSPDPDQEYFADGLSEELLNCLTKIPNLLVSSRTSSFSYKGTDKKAREIASELGVAHILEGSVRKAGNTLRITAQLIRANDGFHLWSNSYNKELKDVTDILSIQEDIATAVANELKLTLGIGKAVKQLGGTDNLEAYELYLVARGQVGNLGMPQAIELLDAAISLDPNFALAWAFKSDLHYRSSIHGPSNRSDIELDASLRAAQKAIDLEPNLVEGLLMLGAIQTLKCNWIEAELYYLKVLELINEPLSAKYEGIATFYGSMGKFKRALELLEEIRRNDPINSLPPWYYQICGFLGDRQSAEEEYQRTNKSRQNREYYFEDLVMTEVRIGSGDKLSPADIVSQNQIHAMGKEYLNSPKEGLMKLRQIDMNDEKLSPSDISRIALWSAYFGDYSFAMEVIENVFCKNTLHVWHPVMSEFRQLPRFKEFVREIGLVGYWKEFGWPDLCRPVGDDDFVCD